MRQADLASLKYNADKLDIDKLKNFASNLSNLKSKLNKLAIEKWVSACVGLSKLSDVVKNDVVAKVVYNAKMKNNEDKITDITKLATNATFNAKINEDKNEILSITNWATTTVLTAVENKILNVNNLVTKGD